MQSERQEQVARSQMRTVEETLQHGGSKAKRTALDTLHNFLDKTRFYNPAIDECFALLVKIAAETDSIMYIKSAVLSQRNRVVPLAVSHMRDTVNVCLKAGAGIVARAVEKAAAMKQQPPLEEVLFREMTGATAQERGKSCYLDPAFHNYMEIVKAVLQSMDKIAKFEPLIQETCRTAITLAAEHGRSYELGIFQALLKTHLREVFEGGSSAVNHQRDQIIGSAETLTSIILTKQIQTGVARQMRDWAGAVGIMRELRNLVQTLRRLERTVKAADMCPVFELEAEVLFAANNAPFHAMQSVTVANQRIFGSIGSIDGQTAKLLASQAVLAVLCVPDKQLSAGDSQERYMHLAKMLGLMAPPSRESLLADVEKQQPTTAGGVASLLSHALPCVRDLYALFCSTPTIEICQLAAPLLKQVGQLTSSGSGAAGAAATASNASTASGANLTRYVSHLEGVAIRMMMGIMSKCFSSVGIDDFVRRCGGILSKDDVGSRIEPLVREKFGAGVTIVVDFGSGRIFFQPSAVNIANLVSFQSSLSAHISQVVRGCYTGAVASAPAAAAAAAPSSKAPTAADKKKKAASVLSRIEDSRTRVLTRYVVCKSRIDNFAARIQALDEADRKRRAEDLLTRAAKEGEKVSIKRKAAEAAMKKAIEEEEAVERRKWVITQVKSRHKGVEIPASLATTSPSATATGSSAAAIAAKKIDDTEFLTEASARLLTFLRATEASRTSDVKTMEHFERACREVEIPTRKRLFEEQTAKQAENAKLQAENRRKAHEAAFNEALTMKKKLERLLSHKDCYEQQVLSSFEEQQRKASSKADRQEDDLERMMRERDAQAAAAAAAKK